MFNVHVTLAQIERKPSQENKPLHYTLVPYHGYGVPDMTPTPMDLLIIYYYQTELELATMILQKKR